MMNEESELGRELEKLKEREKEIKKRVKQIEEKERKRIKHLQGAFREKIEKLYDEAYEKNVPKELEDDYNSKFHDDCDCEGEILLREIKEEDAEDAKYEYEIELPFDWEEKVDKQIEDTKESGKLLTYYIKVLEDFKKSLKEFKEAKKR